MWAGHDTTRAHARHVCITCASIVPDQQIHNDESQAFEDSGYFSKISDKSVVL